MTSTTTTKVAGSMCLCSPFEFSLRSKGASPTRPSEADEHIREGVSGKHLVIVKSV